MQTLFKYNSLGITYIVLNFIGFWKAEHIASSLMFRFEKFNKFTFGPHNVQRYYILLIFSNIFFFVNFFALGQIVFLCTIWYKTTIISYNLELKVLSKYILKVTKLAMKQFFSYKSNLKPYYDEFDQKNLTINFCLVWYNLILMYIKIFWIADHASFALAIFLIIILWMAITERNNLKKPFLGDSILIFVLHV